MPSQTPTSSHEPPRRPGTSAPPSTPRRGDLDAATFVRGTRNRELSILARTLTLVESQSERHRRLAEDVLTQLLPHAGHAIRVGITGVPGAGKSTFIEQLGLQLVEAGRQLAVLAVDPSSSVTGGSILGDKTRMARLAVHPQAFIRPTPSAGSLGGVARRTREAIVVLEAAGFDVILVETVGVGQSETMVSEMTDCFLALMTAGAGDELQGIKRGLLELVDFLAVNKADGANTIPAQIAAKQYQLAFHSLTSRGHTADAPQVFTCSALHGLGISEIWEALQARFKKMQESGRLQSRRSQQNLRWLWAQVDEQLRMSLKSNPQVEAIRPELERQVLAGTLPAETASRKILQAFGQPTVWS